MSCTGLQAVDPLCYAASAAGSIGGSVAVAGIDAVFNGLSQWVASGAEWLLSQIGNVLVSTTSINLGADWFVEHYKVMTALAGVVVLPLLLVSTLQAVYRQNAGQLVRSFFVQLPLALLLGVVAVQIVILCLSATDALCTEVAGGSGSDVHALLAGMSKGLVIAVADPGMATFVLLLVGLLVAAASFVLWLELLVRAAAVYVAVLFLPLAMATLVWPDGGALVPPPGRDADRAHPFEVRDRGDPEPGRRARWDRAQRVRATPARALRRCWRAPPCSCSPHSSRSPFSGSSRWSKRARWDTSTGCGNAPQPGSPSFR